MMLLVCSRDFLAAQPVLTPENMALGGGGSTYITDYAANFYNPANLFIKDRAGNDNFGFLITGTRFNPVQSYTDLNTQRKNFQDYLLRYKPDGYAINMPEREQILDHNYPGNRQIATHQSRFETIWFGVHHINNNHAFSLAMRSRTASAFRVGRNWYTNTPIVDSSGEIANRALKQYYQTMHEISFGYSESLMLLSDLSSRPQNILIGIAPKLVLGGAYQFADWSNSYKKDDITGDIIRKQRFSFDAAGRFNAAVNDYLNGSNAADAVTKNINPVSSQILDINGIGAGLDVGVTYVFALDKQPDFINPKGGEVISSIRVALSVTDLGWISYGGENISYRSDAASSVAAGYPAAATDAFIGVPGQFLVFTDRFAESNPFTETVPQKDKMTVLLPTALHSGILFDFNRIKFSGDFSRGLNQTAFHTNKLLTSLGIEIRPLKNIPIRAGTQFGAATPGLVGFGSALETRYWDFSLAAQLVLGPHLKSSSFSGLTVAVLQFHL